jgi:hypothetical protein
VVVQGGILAVVIQGGRGASLGLVLGGSILAVVVQGGILAVVIQGGRGALTGLGVGGAILAVVVQGGILAVVVQGGRFPFFSPSACSGPHSIRWGPALALVADPPCAQATATLTRPTATVALQPTATATLQPTATATTAPQPTNTPLPPPPQLTVSPTQTTAFCLNNTYPAITVKNTGGQQLNWSATGPSTPAVVTPSPANGLLDPGASQTINVSGSSPGPTVSIQFTSNGGSATVTYTCQ